MIINEYTLKETDKDLLNKDINIRDKHLKDKINKLNTNNEQILDVFDMINNKIQYNYFRNYTKKQKIEILIRILDANSEVEKCHYYLYYIIQEINKLKILDLLKIFYISSLYNNLFYKLYYILHLKLHSRLELIEMTQNNGTTPPPSHNNIKEILIDLINYNNNKDLIKLPEKITKKFNNLNKSINLDFNNCFENIDKTIYYNITMLEMLYKSVQHNLYRRQGVCLNSDETNYLDELKKIKNQKENNQNISNEIIEKEKEIESQLILLRNQKKELKKNINNLFIKKIIKKNKNNLFSKKEIIFILFGSFIVFIFLVKKKYKY